MILTILQARMSSKRLPGKVLKPLMGHPMLWHEIKRALRSQRSDRLLVATSQETSDDPIEAVCKEMNMTCYRGSLEDVLDRYYQAARLYAADHVVRITGDCPLIDPEVMDQTIDFYLAGKYDYASNCRGGPTYPDGLDTEVMPFRCLEEAWRDARLPTEREHVTPFLYDHPERFKIGLLKNKDDLSTLRWTVDNADDFNFISKIYEKLYTEKPHFTMKDILTSIYERTSTSL